VKNGLKGSEPNMAVKVQGAGPRASAYWIVNGGLAKGDVSVPPGPESSPSAVATAVARALSS
jgi:hypothetical protein